MLTEEHDAFHVEKEEILKAALESGQIQTEDVGTRDRLLVVLDRPTTPLHNNLSEIGGCGAKVKSKISGGPRTDFGRRAWDTFGSLNLTCRRLGISFYDFLMDRLLDLNKIARPGDVIGERIQSVVTRNTVNDLVIVLNVA